MKKYRILTRYQYRVKEGVVWTKWLQATLRPTYDTLKEAKDAVKQLKEDTKVCDKVTKLKHEFDIEEYEYNPNDNK